MKKSVLKSLLAIMLIACMMLSACSSATGETTAATGDTTAAAGDTTAAEGDTTAAEGETTAATGDTTGNHDGQIVKCAYSGICDTIEAFESAFSNATKACSAQYYSPLMTRDGDHQIIPCVAESYEMSEDGKTYTFHINPNATFSDGSKITADDVVFSFDGVKNSGRRGHNANSIESYTATDENTVVVTLNYPDALFLGRVADSGSFPIVSKAAYEKFGAEYGTSIDKAVYSGAYVPTEWVPNVSMTFKAREDYWLGAPEIKDAIVYNITDTNGTIVAIQTGDLDMSWTSVSGSSYETLKGVEGVHFTDYMGARFENINFYHKSGMFSDVRMRQAVAYAVNPEEALQVAIDGKGFVTRYPYDTPSQAPAINYDSPYAIKQDVEKAKALVEECGNTGAHVVISSYQPDPYPALSTWLQSVLAGIGLDAEVQVMERGAWLDACNAEELTISMLSLNGSDYDLDGMINYLGAEYNGTRGNYGWYYSEQMENLITEARNKVGDDRADTFKAIIDLMWQDVVLVPLFDWSYSLPVRDTIIVPDGLNWCIYSFKWND